MPLIDVSSAARKLGVNPQRVRALASQGRLPAQKVGNRWLFDSDRLFDEERKSRSNGRPYSPMHAQAILFLASGEQAPWLSSYESWRLERYALPRLRELLPRLRGRAQVSFWRAPESALRRIGSDDGFVRSGVSAADHYKADVLAPGVLDVYCANAVIKQLVRRYALIQAAERGSNLVLRGVADGRFLQGRRVMPRAVVAADLADSADDRTRRAGLRLLSGSP